MDWGSLLLLAIFGLAGVFFILALFYRTEPRVLQFTSYGLITLAILGIITLWFNPAEDLKIAVFVFSALAAVFHWFYRGTWKDRS